MFLIDEMFFDEFSWTKRSPPKQTFQKYFFLKFKFFAKFLKHVSCYRIFDTNGILLNFVFEIRKKHAFCLFFYRSWFICLYLFMFWFGSGSPATYSKRHNCGSMNLEATAYRYFILQPRLVRHQYKVSLVLNWFYSKLSLVCFSIAGPRASQAGLSSTVTAL